MTNVRDQQRRVPAIRFKGFHDVWEKRKFEDFIKKTGQPNKDGSYTKSYSVSNTEGLIPQNEQFEGSRLDALDKTSYKIVRPNEFAYNPARINVGSIAYNNLGRTVIVSSLYVVISISEELNNSFALEFIKSPAFLSEVRKNTEGGVRQYLFIENFRRIRLPFTRNILEQQKIGELLSRLDHLIAVNQRKRKTLQNLKKALLQRMFVSGKSTVPDIRFDGFTDAWEKRKLGDVVAKIKSYSLSRDVERFEDTGYQYVHYGDIHTGVADNITERSELPNIEPADYVELRINDLIVADASEDYLGIAEPAVVSGLPAQHIVAGLHTIALRPKTASSKFLYYLLHTNDFKHFGYRMGTGLKVFGISWSNLSKFSFMIPSRPEQDRIVDGIETVDNLIVVNQRKTANLQKLKQALLQKMFV